jgi:hypothetical protein
VRRAAKAADLSARSLYKILERLGIRKDKTQA